MSDPSITGPNDDELLGHGGVEVPTDGIDDIPQASGEEQTAQPTDESGTEPAGAAS